MKKHNKKGQKNSKKPVKTHRKEYNQKNKKMFHKTRETYIFKISDKGKF